ncbi:hypothetical protein A7U60_g2227 [Sanghuangporus baumii]|uniref:DUF6533 domain-containing protein n=1 Tax=Sanghuangporus baumii TaxID=108892 RepID=A0A9Q5I2N4_SANBA|nr:hypothetical protein A7U60_g2227 [Sanghuangporus baumii]
MVNNSISADHLRIFITFGHELFAQRLARLSAMIVVIYDTLLTMDREIEFFWERQKQRWSYIKVIYFVNRYGGLLILVVDTWAADISISPKLIRHTIVVQFYFQQWTGIYNASYRRSSDSRLFFRLRHCLPFAPFVSNLPVLPVVDISISPKVIRHTIVVQFYFQQWTGWIAVLLVEVILIIRVNTLYERSRTSTLVLSTIFFAQAALMATVLIKWDLISILVFFDDIHACGSQLAPPYWISFFWLPPIIMDFILLVLTLRKSLALRRITPGKSWSELRLHRTLVRDQALYFVGIFICSLANMGFFTIYPKILCAALGFALGFPCVMGSRILLNLREIAREEMRCGLSTSKVFTSIQFAEQTLRQQESIASGSELRIDQDADGHNENETDTTV